jgi:hypothetical protein
MGALIPLSQKAQLVFAIKTLTNSKWISPQKLMPLGGAVALALRYSSDKKAALVAEVIMAAPYRGNTGHSVYFITACTFQKGSLFQSDRMAKLFIEILSTTAITKTTCCMSL